MPTLSIIVVSYNTASLTLECLRSIYKETDADFELLVVDNASTDNSAGLIATEFGDSAKVISLPQNIGFAAANNLAAEQANGEYILLLNPDTVVLDAAIDKLIKRARETDSPKIWGGRTLFPDGNLNPTSCWSRQTLWGLLCQALGLSSLFRKSCVFNPEGIGCWNRNGVRYVDIVSGCFLLITRKLWRELGGFSEKFFMYGEDADLCLRAAKLGAKPLIDSNATIIHLGGASEKNKAEKLIKLINAKRLLIMEHFWPSSRRLACWLLASWPRSRACAYGVGALLLPRLVVKREMWRKVSEGIAA